MSISKIISTIFILILSLTLKSCSVFSTNPYKNLPPTKNDNCNECKIIVLQPPFPLNQGSVGVKIQNEKSVTVAISDYISASNNVELIVPCGQRLNILAEYHIFYNEGNKRCEEMYTLDLFISPQECNEIITPSDNNLELIYKLCR